MQNSSDLNNLEFQFSSVSHVQLFANPWTAAYQASLSITNSWSLLKLMSIESVMPFNHLILYYPPLLLPSIFPSIRVFPVSQLFISGGQSTGVSAAASVLPMKIQGWLPLGLTGLSALPSKDSRESSPAPLLESINSSVHSHLYGPTLTSVYNYWKNQGFDYETCVGKVMSLLFNTLTGFLIALSCDRYSFCSFCTLILEHPSFVFHIVLSFSVLSRNATSVKRSF